MSEAQYYQIEEIVGFKNIRGVPHYKVRWQGYSRNQDSWEPSSNLAACSQLIDEFNARKASPQKKTRRTTRPVVAGKTLAELSPEEVPTLRRSQRARTPTRYFMSEVDTTTTATHRKQQPAPPTKPPKKTTSPKKRQRHQEEEEEEDTDEDEFDVQRSEYELRKHFAQRRSPRRHEEIHYFNSELPMPRQSAKGGSATTALKAVLSTDEEEERGGQELSLTPQISVYESRVRKRLSSLSSLTRKNVTEALTSITNKEDNKSASLENSGTSQPAEPPSSSSALHVYETRSRATQPHPMEPLTSSLSPVVARRKIHSSTTVTTTTTTTAVPSTPKTRDQQPSSLDNSTDSPPDITPFDPQPLLTSEKAPPALPSSPTTEKVPQWMKFGWGEAFFIFIVICLSAFAYYCFYSDNC